MSDEGLTPEEQKQFEQMQADDGTQEPERPAEGATGSGGEEGAGGESKAGAGKAAEPPEKPAPTVPLSALHEERERRRDLQRRIEEMERKQQESDKAAEPAPPDFDQDPAGYLRAQIDKMASENAAEKQAREQREQQQQQQDQARQVQQRAAQMEQEFAAKQEDYPDALAFLRQRRAEEISAFYPTATPQQIEQAIQQDAAAVLFAAMQNGQNPAEQLYKIAKVRGYAPKPKETGNGGSQDEGADKLDRIERGQQQSEGLGAAKGGAPPAGGILAALKMSDEEFAKRYGDDAEFRKIAGN